MARPTDFTPELGVEICRRLSAGASLRDIGRCRDMPCISTISAWIVENRGNFAELYTRARQQRAYVVADELLDLIAGITKDIPSGPGGMPVVIARKEQITALRWFLSKVLRHEYGEQLHVDHDHRFRTKVVITLPGKQSALPRQHVIEGEAQHMLEDDSDS